MSVLNDRKTSNDDVLFLFQQKETQHFLDLIKSENFVSCFGLSSFTCKDDFFPPHLQKQTCHPSFPRRHWCRYTIDNIRAANYCLNSVLRRLIEPCNVFISAEFVLLLEHELVTYFSASLAHTSSCKPWAVLRKERQREGGERERVQTYVSLSLIIKTQSFLHSSSLGLKPELQTLQGAPQQPCFSMQAANTGAKEREETLMEA